ncbi:MAG: hypothetical protein WBW61_04170 [Rhodanobacteraceae bacterium]
MLLRLANAAFALTFLSGLILLGGTMPARASPPEEIVPGLGMLSSVGLPIENRSEQQPLLVQGEPVIPLWTSPDGRLLTIVALSQAPGAPVLPRSPTFDAVADWRTLGASGGTFGGLRWDLGNGFHADTLLGDLLASPVVCATATCASDATGTGAVSFTNDLVTGSLGLGWTSAGGDLDLSYGLSWLQSGAADRVLPLTNASAEALPVLALPGMLPYQLESSTALVARGSWRIGGPTTLDFGASVGQGHFLSFGQDGALVPGIDLNQASLSLGVGAGSIRGVIVGHLLTGDTPVLPGGRWTTLDLGVSWRTPWQGELSVGAQNLFALPGKPPLARDADPAQTRMPYIQYRQDL